MIDTSHRAPIFRARRLGHVNFFVDDLARSTAFYNSVCGLALEFVETGLKASFLGTGHTPHDVGCIETTKGKDRRGKDGHLQIPKEIGTRAGLNHLAWEVANEAELVAGYRRCCAAGLKINRLADHQIAHSIYMQDPDGNTIEFYVDMVKEWRSVLHGELELITSVWDPEAGPHNPEPLYDEAPERRDVAAAPIHPWRLSHAVLASPDTARLAAFYQQVAGLRLEAEEGGAYILRGIHDGYSRSLVIVPRHAGDATASNLHHFALELSNERALEDGADGLARHNIAIERRLRTAAKQSIFLRDPDGHRIEFFATRGEGAVGLGSDPDAI